MENKFNKLRQIIEAVNPILKMPIVGKPNLLESVEKDINSKICNDSSISTMKDSLFEDSEIKVLVCGEFKRGKSSFINALLGVTDDSICPVDTSVCTSVASIIKYGEEKKVTRYYGNSTDLSKLNHETISFDEINSYAVGNEYVIQNTVCLKIEVPSELLKNNIVFIDTPGVGGLDPRHAAITSLFLPLVDITLFVTHADEPLTDSELSYFANNICKYSKYYAVLVNKSDILQKEEVEGYCEDILNKLNECHVQITKDKVIPISSKYKLQSNKDKNSSRFYQYSNFGKLEKLLDSLLERYQSDLIHSFSRKIVQLLGMVIDGLKKQQELLSDNASDDNTLEIEINRLADLNSQNNSLRLDINRILNNIQNRVSINFNDRCILLKTHGFNDLLNNKQANGANGGIWIGNKIQEAINSIGVNTATDLRQAIIDLNQAIEEISNNEQFNGVITPIIGDFYYNVPAVNVSGHVSIQERYRDFIPGVGIGGIASTIVGTIGLTGFVAVAIPVILGGCMLISNLRNTNNVAQRKALHEKYQSCISLALNHLQDYVNTSLNDIQKDFIQNINKCIGYRQLELRKVEMLKRNSDKAKSYKMQIDKIIYPLIVLQRLALVLSGNPFM